MNKIYEEIKTGSSTVLCTECGELNPVGDENCFNCQAPLEHPAPLWRNVVDVLGRPLEGMRRVAATMPWLQGIFIYVGLLFLVLFVQIWVLLSWGQAVVDHKIPLSPLYVNRVMNAREGAIPLTDAQRNALNASTDQNIKLTPQQSADLDNKDSGAILLTSQQYTFLRDNTDTNVKLTQDQINAAQPKADSPPSLNGSFLLTQALNFAIQIAFTAVFALAISVTARLLYRNEAKPNFKSLFSVATFAQLASLLTILLMLILVFVPDLSRLLFDPGASRDDPNNPVGIMLQFAPFIYQVTLLVIGVKFSAKLTWMHSFIVVALISILLRFFLQLPF